MTIYSTISSLLHIVFIASVLSGISQDVVFGMSPGGKRDSNRMDSAENSLFKRPRYDSTPLSSLLDDDFADLPDLPSWLLPSLSIPSPYPSSSPSLFDAALAERGFYGNNDDDLPNLDSNRLQHSPTSQSLASHSSAPSPAQAAEQKIQCTYPGCERVFAQSRYLINHMRTHKKEALKQKIKQMHINRTMHRIHAAETNVEDVALPSLAPSSSASQAENNQPPAQAPQELRELTPSDNADVVAPTPKPYVCTQHDCNRKFSTPERLNEHLFYHTDSDDSDFIPDVAIKERRKVKVPKQIQAQAKPYTCDCGKAFSNASALKWHTLKHMVAPPPPSPSDIPNQSVVSDAKTDSDNRLQAIKKPATHIQKNKDKHYACTITGCNRIFSRKADRNNHVITHLATTSYTCMHQGCGFKAPLKADLVKHIKAEHMKRK